MVITTVNKSSPYGDIYLHLICTRITSQWSSENNIRLRDLGGEVKVKARVVFILTVSTYHSAGAEVFVATKHLQLTIEVLGNYRIGEESHRIDGFGWVSRMSRVVPITLQTIGYWSVGPC